MFTFATACSGKSSDLFEDNAGGDGSEEETGGSSSAGNGSSGDDGAGGSGATSTGGRATVTGGAPAGGKIGVGGTSAGGAIAVGGAPAGGMSSSSSGAGGAFPGGGFATGGTFGGAIGVGGAILGGKSSVGGSSPGGSGGVASVCVDPDGSDYKKRGTTTGSNGTFEDTCQDGDLIEYVCENSACGAMTSSGAADVPGIALPQAGRGAIPPPCTGDPGRVTQRRIACGGRCDSGTCFAWCPGANDELTYQDVAGAEVVLDNDSKNARYRCEATSSTGDVDCTDPALEGQTIEVGSLVSCSATVISFVARMPENASCDYRCSLDD